MYNRVVNTSLIKSCSFFGHSKIELSEELKIDLEKLIKRLVLEEKVRFFYFGGFGEFDDLCYEIVSKLKEKYNDIKRVFVLHDIRHKRADKRPKWISEQRYEDIIYFELKFNYWYTKIYYRNCAIIENSDYVVFYVNNFLNSGAGKAFSYAKKIKKAIFNIASIN